MEDKFRVLRNAEKFVVNRQFDRAVTEYRKIIDIHGEDPSVLNTLGDLLLKTNQQDQALECFSRVAEIFSQSGFISKAIAIYRKVEQLNPSTREAVGKLAELYTRRGLRSEALKYWRRAGNLLEQAGERDGLITARRQVAEMDPENPLAHRELAEVLSPLVPDESAEEYLKASRLFLGAKAYAEARDTAQEALTLDAASFEAREIIAEADENLPQETPETAETAPELPAGAPDLLLLAEEDAIVEALPVEALPVEAGPELVGESEFVAAEFFEEPVKEELVVDDLQAEADRWSESLAEDAFFELEGNGPVDAVKAEDPVEVPVEPPGQENSFFAELTEGPGEQAAAVPPPLQGVQDEMTPEGASTAGVAPPAVSNESRDSLKDLLDEVDFYLKLDLREDAERILRGLLEKDPDEPRVRARAERLGLVATSGTAPVGGEEELEPYAADVESALEDLFFEDPGEAVGTGEGTAVESATEADSTRAHFDLGVAYREMGMFEDAVAKFLMAYEVSIEQNRVDLQLNCAALLASTHLLLDNSEQSLKWADIALGLPRNDLQDYKALEYERAAALELSGRTEESLEAYKRIMAEDPEFRDVRERVARLGQMPG
jgi:tetratricopeptide (TPR) repeat protein